MTPGYRVPGDAMACRHPITRRVGMTVVALSQERVVTADEVQHGPRNGSSDGWKNTPTSGRNSRIAAEPYTSLLPASVSSTDASPGEGLSNRSRSYRGLQGPGPMARSSNPSSKMISEDSR